MKLLDCVPECTNFFQGHPVHGNSPPPSNNDYLLDNSVPLVELFTDARDGAETVRY